VLVAVISTAIRDVVVSLKQTELLDFNDFLYYLLVIILLPYLILV